MNIHCFKLEFQGKHFQSRIVEKMGDFIFPFFFLKKNTDRLQLLFGASGPAIGSERSTAIGSRVVNA